MSETQPAADESKSTSATPLRRLGKYEIQKKLGQGGMGAVYLAIDTQLKRTVALKVLPKDKAKNPILVKRFHAEAQTAAALRHDNIILVYEADHADGYDYMAMEYVDGVDAARLVETRGVLPVRRSIEIVRQVAQALDHAARQGVVHRDIKPANLMIRRDGGVKLADMGLARIVDDTIDTGITRVGTTVGTVDYMSPEQARDSKAADVRSDLYSLGCTWYFLLTGEPPFPEGALTNKLRAHAEKPPPDPRQLNANVPESVVAVLNRMLAKQPKARYQTPADLIADLDQGAKAQQNLARVLLDEDSSEVAVAAPGPEGRRIVPDDSSSDVEAYDSVVKRKPEPASKGNPKPVPAKKEEPGLLGFWGRLLGKKGTAQPEETPAAPAGRSERKKSSSRPSGRTGPEEIDVEEDTPRRKSRSSTPQEAGEEVDEETTSSRRKSRTSAPQDAGNEVDDDAVAPRRKSRSSTPQEAGEEVDEETTSSRRKSRTSAPQDAGNEVDDDAVAPRRKSRSSSAPREAEEEGDETVSRRRRSAPVEEPVEESPSRRSSRGRVEPNEADDERSVGRSRKNRIVTAKATASGGASSESELEDEAAREKRIERRNALMFYVAATALVIGAVGLGGYAVLRISRAFDNPAAAVAVNPFGQGQGVEAVAGAKAAGKAGDPTNKTSGESGAVDVVPETSPPDATPEVVASRPPDKTVWELEELPLWPGEALPRMERHTDLLIESQSGELPYTVINPELARAKESDSLTIRLSGQGPFALRPIQFANYKRVTLTRAKETETPLILALPPDGADAPEQVSLIQPRGMFEARGVEFVIDAAQFPKSKVVALIAAEQCDVRLTGCRVTAVGDGDESPAVSVVQVAGPAVNRGDDPAVTRVWLQETAIRGDKVTGVELVTPAVDLIVRDSFVWTQSGSGVRCAGAAADADPKVVRNVRLRRSTVIGGRQAIEFAGSADRPVPVEIDWRQSVAGHVRDAKQSTVGRFSGWTNNQVRGALGRQLLWKSQGSRYRGQTALLAMDDAEGAVIAADEETWRERWQSPDAGHAGEFVREEWPASAPKVAQLVEPRLFTEPIDTKSDEGRPGAVFDAVVFTPFDTVRSVLAESRLPQIPEFFAVPSPALKTVEVDLNRDDLAKVLMDPALGPWVEVVAKGGGVRPLGPITIRDRYVRLRCLASDGRLTSFQPRQVDDVWITVVNGGLEIEGAALGTAVLDKSARDKVSQPKWYFRLEAADLSLKSCRVQSPVLGGQRTEGLIQVSGGAGLPKRPVPLAQRGYVVVQRSFLSTGGIAIKADLRGRDVHLRDSAVLSRTDMALFSTGAESGEPVSRFDVRRSTLSGCSSIVRIEKAGGDGAVVPIEARFRSTVFARPFVKLAQKTPPSLLAVPTGLVMDRGLAWTETRCGYAPEWLKSVLREGESKEARDWPGWVALWGEGAIKDALAGPADVVAAGDWPQDPTRVDVTHLELSGACKASKWDGGRPIGAPIANLAGRLERSSATAVSPGTVRPGTKPAGL